MKKNIAIVANYIYPTIKSGDAQAAINEIHELNKNGFEIVVLSEIDSNFNPIRKDKYLPDGIRIFNNPDQIKTTTLNAIICHQPSSIKLSLQLKKKFNCPIICRHHINLEVLAALADKLNCPTSDLFDRDSPSNSIRQYKQFINSADMLLDVDPLRYKTKEKSEFIPPFFSMNISNNLIGNRNLEKKVMLCGRLDDPMKGYDRIISFIKLASKHSIEVNIVGNLSDQQNEVLSKYNNVVFHHWIKSRSELFKLMQITPFFISLSHYEPFGLAAAESVANGCCLIGSHEGFASLCNQNNLSTTFNNSLETSEITKLILQKILNLSSDKNLYHKVVANQQKVLNELNKMSENYSNFIAEKINKIYL